MYLYHYYLVKMIIYVIIVLNITLLPLVIHSISRKKERLKVDKSYYYRDIPCFKSINVAYWLLYKYSKISKKQLSNNLINTYLLSWYKMGHISIVPSNDVSDKDSYLINLQDGNWDKDYCESKIYDLLQDIAGNNNLLERKELRDYCSVEGNCSVAKVFEDIFVHTQSELEESGYISVIKGKNFILFSTEDKTQINDELKNEYKNLIGLKNFLSDFSNMQEKESIEVHNWDEYMIFATLLGIANNVNKQFKEINPEITDDNFIIYAGDYSKEVNKVSFKNAAKGILALIIMFAIIELLKNNIRKYC